MPAALYARNWSASSLHSLTRFEKPYVREEAESEASAEDDSDPIMKCTVSDVSNPNEATMLVMGAGSDVGDMQDLDGIDDESQFD
jgi:hypothetical protein